MRSLKLMIMTAAVLTGLSATAQAGPLARLFGGGRCRGGGCGQPPAVQYQPAPVQYTPAVQPAGYVGQPVQFQQGVQGVVQVGRFQLFGGFVRPACANGNCGR